MSKKISIIIPVYKVERYLHECVDSVLSSTYKDLEIILVDDGSPDGCPQICDEYAQKNSRIKVIHQKNQGLCAARNAGLKVATGEYVAFVDSDDVISPFLYEKLVQTIETENADWAACEYTRKQDTLLVDHLSSPGNIYVMESIESVLSVLTCAPAIRKITWTSAYVWNKLYRRELITKSFLSNCLNVEDMQFNWDYMQNSKKMVVISLPLYYYRVVEESITETYRKTNTDKLADRSFCMAKVNEHIAEQISSEHTELKRYMIARTVNVMHGGLFRLHAYNIAKQHPDFCRYCGKYVRKHWKTVWREKETYNLRARLPVFVFTFAYPLWVLATKVIKA